LDEQANTGAELAAVVATDVAETVADAAHATDADVIAEQARVIRRKGAYTDALALCEAALADAPDDACTSLWREKAAALDALERYDEALAAVERALALAPEDARNVACKSSVMIRLKRLDEAMALVDHALALDDYLATAWNARGNILFEQEQYDEAIAAYERAHAIDPDDWRCVANVGNALTELGRYDEALAALDRAQELESDQFTLAINRAYALNVMARAGDTSRFAEALAVLDQSPRPESTYFWFQRGNALRGLERYDEAVAAFERVIVLDPDDNEARYNKAATLNDIFQLDLALESVDQGLANCQTDAKLRKDLLELKWYLLNQLERYEDECATLIILLEMEPEHAGALSDYAQALYYLRRPEEALLYAERSLALNPSNALTWRTKGLILEAMNQDEEALTAFEESLRLDGADAFVWAQKAVALRRLERTDEALPAIEMALSLNNSDDFAWHSKGLILEELQRDEEALAAFTRALVLNSSHTFAAQELAAALYRLERYDEALPAYEQAIGLDAADEYMWYFKGRTLAFLNRHEEALAAYDQALALIPDDWDALNQKSTSLMALNRYEETIGVYERMSELQPQNADVIRGKASCLRNLKRYDEALACVEQAQELPRGIQNANLWAEKVYALVYLKRFDEATQAFDAATVAIPALATSGDLRLFVGKTLRRTIPDQRLRLKDGRWLGYLDYGDPDGAPILYFHGIPGSRLECPFDDATLKRLHIRIIAPDRPGFGLSDFQRRRRMLDWPNDVVELAEHLGIRRFAVIGVSGGGAYAAACAYTIPLRLTKVGLVSSASPLNRRTGPDAAGRRYTNRYSFVIQRLTPLPLARVVNELMARMFLADPEAVWRAHHHWLGSGAGIDDRFLSPVNASAFTEPYRHGAHGLAWDSRLATRRWGFRLHDISAAVYLWQGEQDAQVLPAMGRYLAQAIPNCQATFYPDEGHRLFERHSEEILAALV